MSNASDPKVSEPDALRPTSRKSEQANRLVKADWGRPGSPDAGGHAEFEDEIDGDYDHFVLGGLTCRVGRGVKGSKETVFSYDPALPPHLVRPQFVPGARVFFGHDTP